MTLTFRNLKILINPCGFVKMKYRFELVTKSQLNRVQLIRSLRKFQIILLIECHVGSFILHYLINPETQLESL